MRTLILLSLAAPGALAGYAVLTGYLIARMKPVPITFMPENKIISLDARPDDGLDEEPRAVAV